MASCSSAVVTVILPNIAGSRSFFMRARKYMWTELFLENKEPLLFEIDTIIKSLTEYRDAILSDDADTLRGLLRDGRIAKEKVDG